MKFLIFVLLAGCTTASAATLVGFKYKGEIDGTRERQKTD